MKKANKAFKVCAVAAAALCVSYAFSEQPRSVLNAKQLGIEDLNLDDLDDLDFLSEEESTATKEVVENASAEDNTAEVVEEAVEDVADVVEEVAEEPVAEVAEEPASEEVAEEVAEELPEVDELVEEATEEAPAEAVEEVAEEVVEETPEEAVEEAVEEVAEEAAVEDVADDILEELDEAVEEESVEEDVVEDVLEDIAETVEEETTEDVVEEVAEEAPAEEVEAPAVAADDAADDVPVADDDVLGEKVAEKVIEDTPENRAVAELAELAKTRRKIIDEHCKDCLRNAEDALVKGKYDTAIKYFEECIKLVRDSKVDLRNQADNGLAEAYYRKARMLMQINNFDEAEVSARQARQRGHEKAEILLSQITELKNNPPPPPEVKTEKRWNQPSYKEMRGDVRKRMKVAREYYATGEYMDCRRELEFILRDYPWTKEAVDLLRRVNKLIDQYYDNEREAARREMIGNVTDAWSSKTYGVEFSDIGYKDRSASANGESDDVFETTEEMAILEKMRTITIPELDFRQANITDVITFLSEASREYDSKDIPEERRGVNIVLNLGLEGADTSAPAASDFGGDAFSNDFSDDSSSSASSGGVPLITINSRFITLAGALDTVMDMADLKYRVKGNMVQIMRKSAPDGDLLLRMYPVLPSFVEKAASFNTEEKASGGFGDPTQIETATFTATKDWKAFFGELGVQWPEGSTVKYVSTIGKLIVKNTSENLSSLEKVLAVLNVTPHQVEIEVRFVEVMQTDLDSLGLEWTLNSNWDIAHNKNDVKNGIEPRRIQMGAGSINSGFNYLTENTNMKINNGSPVNDAVATFSSILTNPELSVVLHMLSSRQNTDLLSAPKVVVAGTGQEAQIKVVTEYIYPTSYDVEMLESSNNDSDTSTYTGAVVEPGDFMTREVGVILSVTPEVAPDGSRIFLSLNPSVVSEPTWKNYGSSYPQPVEIGRRFNPLTLSYEPIYEIRDVKLMMEQPFFPVRSVVTQLEVYNGSTVVMGGMITEERHTNEDKIPILGDLPLIGHLFRYKSEQSQKRNLLLFVTARLVDAGGRKIQDGSTDIFKN